jgi:ATP phosphoribosyltransferase
MKRVINEVSKAKLILVPKGDDSVPCLQAFQEAIGIAVPEFEGRKLEAKAGRRTFLKVKGRDIPRLIAAGYGDVGLTGSDSCEEYMNSPETGIAYQAFGPSMCRFVLLAPREAAATTRRRLKGPKLMPVATSFPNLLRKCAQKCNLPLAVMDMALLGSVEIMPRLLGVPLVADLVSSGSTAKANGLVEIASLLDVRPAVVVRTSGSRPKPLKSADYSAIDRIDATLARRSSQLDNKTVASPTLRLMRDPNLAGKKTGEEFAETLMAIFGDGTTAKCESELADLIYTQLVAARSQGKPVELGKVIRTLIDQNKQAGQP